MMELILFFTSNNNLRGTLKDQDGEKEVFCKKLKEKTKTGADKYVCFIVGGKIRIRTVVIGKSYGTMGICTSKGDCEVNFLLFTDTSMSFLVPRPIFILVPMLLYSIS